MLPLILGASCKIGMLPSLKVFVRFQFFIKLCLRYIAMPLEIYLSGIIDGTVKHLVRLATNILNYSLIIPICVNQNLLTTEQLNPPPCC